MLLWFAGVFAFRELCPEMKHGLQIRASKYYSKLCVLENYGVFAAIVVICILQNFFYLIKLCAINYLWLINSKINT